MFRRSQYKYLVKALASAKKRLAFVFDTNPDGVYTRQRRRADERRAAFASAPRQTPAGKPVYRQTRRLWV